MTAPNDPSIVLDPIPSDVSENHPEKADILRVRKPPRGLLVAVEARCTECCGGDLRDIGGTHRILDCKATGCPLRPVRPGQRANPELLWAAIRAKCRRCQGPDPGVELRISTCEIPSCALRPVREYRLPRELLS